MKNLTNFLKSRKLTSDEKAMAVMTVLFTGIQLGKQFPNLTIEETKCSAKQLAELLAKEIPSK